MLTFRNFILFLSTVILFVSCAFVKDHTGGNGMAKVRRADRLFKRQEYEHAVSLCNDVINNGGREEVLRAAKLQLARIYFETRQFEKTLSLYDELLYKPGNDVLVSDVTNYMDLLKRTGRVLKAKEVAETYAKNYKNNARFTNLQESLTNYYTFFNRDSMRNVRVDSLRLNLPGYQYGLALYNDNIVFLSNDFKKNDAQSFYTNSKLYMVSEDGVEPFSNSLKGVLQVGPASFFDHGKKVIYTSNRFDAVKNEKNSYINYNNNTQLLQATYQPEHDNWSKPVPVKIGKNADNYSFLHPSVAPNGKRLYFASDMPGGYGGTDIYYTDWDKEEKRWKAPVNMGPAVNTNGNELYPFVSGDQLFFSSNGLQGFGGQDIFVINVKKPEEGVAHLPYPVNTQFDDLNPVLDVNKRLLYFTSDRSGVHDNDHIYVLNLKKNPLKQLDLPDPGKPLKDDDKVPYTMNQTDDRRQQTLVGDKRYDNISNDSVQQPLPVPVKRVAEPVIANNERPVADYADEPVNSSPEIIPWQNTVNTVTAPTAAAAQAAPAAFSDSRSANAAPDRIGWRQPENPNPATQKGDSLAKVAGVLWHIPGVIYFDLNSYVPQDREWRKLDSIFQVWKAHPQRLILINGHTDVIGAEKYNLALSRNRAVYIQECLRSRGVDPDRIRVNYYGSTKPVMIAKQYSLAADRELFIKVQGVNRRCEVRIL
ncbi:OmpA family protein [Chitinophaga vietnamensis]|uniref:OmpA family protein n=1 Tax=Chitinophaga vietnamensis TaxID=2593957 RepID=UPI0013757A8D|nr:OmpA family protein [Chitinophaga vietnamensis]